MQFSNILLVKKFVKIFIAVGGSLKLFSLRIDFVTTDFERFVEVSNISSNKLSSLTIENLKTLNVFKNLVKIRKFVEKTFVVTNLESRKISKSFQVRKYFSE